MKNDAVYLGLGTNLGDKCQNLINAIQLIEQIKDTKVIEYSSVYQSPAWGFESFDFFNMAISLETLLAPVELLHELQNIEKQMGRSNKSTNGQYAARIIDIDILFYKQVALQSNNLIIPHPAAATRAFVIKPLLEINPHIYLIHNMLQETHASSTKIVGIQRLETETNKILKTIKQ